MLAFRFFFLSCSNGWCDGDAFCGQRPQRPTAIVPLTNLGHCSLSITAERVAPGSFPPQHHQSWDIVASWCFCCSIQHKSSSKGMPPSGQTCRGPNSVLGEAEEYGLEEAKASLGAGWQRDR